MRRALVAAAVLTVTVLLNPHREPPTWRELNVGPLGGNSCYDRPGTQAPRIAPETPLECQGVRIYSPGDYQSGIVPVLR